MWGVGGKERYRAVAPARFPSKSLLSIFRNIYPLEQRQVSPGHT